MATTRIDLLCLHCANAGRLLVQESWRPLAVPVVSSLRIVSDYSDVLLKRPLRFCNKNVFELRRVARTVVAVRMREPYIPDVL